MQASSQKAERIGYIVTKHDDELGFVGGLLVVNNNARPLEFHCTIPLQPKPAQMVLYGATLGPYLLEEQIPKALLGKVRSQPDVLIANQLELVNLSERCQIPLGILTGQETTIDEPDANETRGLLIGEIEFSRVGEISFAYAQHQKRDRETIESAIVGIAQCVDVEEPFERLSIAINETCKSLSNAA